VRRGNEQYHRHGSEQQEQRRAHALHARGLERRHANVFAAQLGERCDDAGEERAQLGLRRLRRGAAREAAGELQEVAATLGALLWREADRQPDVAAKELRTNGQLHACWRDADHGRRLAVHRNGPSHQGRIGAERLAPEFIAHHRNPRLILRVVGRKNEASVLRAHAEHWKEIAGDEHLRDLPPLTARVDQPVVSRQRRQVSELVRLAREVEVVGHGVRPGALRSRLWRGPEHRHQSIRRPEAKRREQSPVNRARDRGGGANAERQAQYGGNGDCGGSYESAGSTAEIGNTNTCHGGVSPVRVRDADNMSAKRVYATPVMLCVRCIANVHGRAYVNDLQVSPLMRLAESRGARYRGRIADRIQWTGFTGWAG